MEQVLAPHDRAAITAYHLRLIRESSDDPVRLAAALARAETGPYVLYEHGGRWSFGAGAAYEVVLTADEITVRCGGTRSVLPTGDEPLQRLATVLAECPLRPWRAYGWAAFELAHLLHGGAVPRRDAPLLHLIVPAREVRRGDDGLMLRAVGGADLAGLAASVAAGPAAGDPGAPLEIDVTATGAAGYRAAVAAAVDDIRAHRLQKVILSRVVPVAGEIDLIATYQAGRRGNTPARSFLLDLGGVRCAGFSPETVVEVAADGTVSTQPLAGTRALLGDRDHDRRLREELCADDKEVFEHAISVKLACEELTPVCRPGSVRVGEFMAVRERGSVQHLASRVTGRLGREQNAWHAFAALFPAVTASGVPKAAACASIARHEEPRGLYSGAVLTVDSDGALDAALVLRSVFQRDGATWLRAGAGVVGRSTPAREFEETCEKLRSVSRFLVPGR